MKLESTDKGKLPKWIPALGLTLLGVVLVSRIATQNQILAPQPNVVVPNSGKFFRSMNPRRANPDVFFMDKNYYKGIRSSSGGWLVPPGYWHTGADWNHPAGGNTEEQINQPFHALTDGVVILAKRMRGTWGNMVVVWYPHALVWGQYGHAKRVNVSPGQIVTPGQVLGIVGRSGMPNGFAHLHETIFKKAPSDWNFFPREDKAAVLEHCVDPLAFYAKLKMLEPPKAKG